MQAPKKMSLMQLTFIVAVNMMGSGIIMLPTNMAKVGAISLLSWIVTALGSMAIAYGFAQAGLFNQREGGMSAYAEDAYGKSGYFNVFYLYFLSLAIGNVAIGISAVGYLATFFPSLSATPIATCISVIALLWLTTVANFGGPAITGKIGAVTVWGVIIPVGVLSLIGWFWFKSDTFAAAWNPQGMSLAQGMGSSISLTLWAFLGMESAAQNSAAVENPKRDVPLACMFGTLGAAVIYILSTTVIQGIVPNAELAKSTGPFGLAYAQMFNPTIGSIIMALAVIACLGSLLGWQFTIAQTGKAAADERMFPALFSKVNRMGAPIAGMIVMGIVQSLLALSTISPTLSEQFSALVNLAVVTNVVPYIIALSALTTMMQAARVAEAVYKRNLVITLIAMLYSVYAIYASGKDAVLGGMLALGIGYVIWGFIAPRFASKQAGAGAPAKAIASLAIAVLAVALLPLAAPSPASAGTLDRVRESGKLTLGYRVDARPFSFKDESGNAAGYSVALCQRIADQVKTDLKLPTLNVAWVPVTLDSRFQDVQQGKVDLLCGVDTVTLARRQEVAFSIPIFPGGIGAMLRADSSFRLREVLSKGKQAGPFWRASPAEILNQQTFSAVVGTTAERWLGGRLNDLQIDSKIVPMASYDAGVRSVLDRTSNAFFGDRAILLDIAKRNPSAQDLVVLDRRFTSEQIALALPRGDDDFRLVVDATLSRFFGTAEFRASYTKWFGAPDEATTAFFRSSGLPD
jgi:putrescine:ornithine antiporter